MDDLIRKLSEIRSEYNCFNQDEEPYYRALSEAISILSRRADGDTIYRQAAIEAITDERIVTNMDSVYDSELHRCKRATHRILASLPSAERWIPVTERLPGKEGLYLITCVDDSGAPFVDASLYDPPTDWRGAIWDFPNVVAWMERPKPYKEGEEE